MSQQPEYSAIVTYDPPSDSGVVDAIVHKIAENTHFVLANFVKRGPAIVAIEYENIAEGLMIEIWAARGGDIRGYAVDRKLITYLNPREYSQEKHRQSIKNLEDNKRESILDSTYLEELEERLFDLIPVFKDRMSGLMKRSPHVKYGTAMYELFVCEEAQALLRYRSSLETFMNWTKLDYAEKISTPGLRKRVHNPVSIEAVEKLVYAHLFSASARKEHAASCKFLGCQLAGCWSISSEAELEREELDAKDALDANQCRTIEPGDDEVESGSSDEQPSYHA